MDIMEFFEFVFIGRMGSFLIGIFIGYFFSRICWEITK